MSKSCKNALSLLLTAGAIGLGAWAIDRNATVQAQDPDPATLLYVSGLGVSFSNVGGPRRQPIAEVEIVDGYGRPVNGAQVVGNWSGCFKENGDSALTQTYCYPQPDGTEICVDGRAIVLSNKTYSCWGSGKKCNFTFTITGVFMNGMTYVPVNGAGTSWSSAPCS